MNNEKVVVSVENSIGTIRLNRPESLNAMDYDVMDMLGDAIESFANNDEVRAVVITGTGRAFSAGGDVKAILAHVATATPEERAQGTVRLNRILVGLRELPKPAIAALNGLTIGAGLYLAMACDIIIATENAYFQNAFIKYGLHPDFAGTYYLPKAVGTAKACELLFTADRIEADEALRIGLINKVVPQEKLYDTVNELCEKIKGFYGPTVAAIKKSVYDIPQMSLEDGIMKELERQLEVIQGDPEGFQAALAKQIQKFNKKA